MKLADYWQDLINLETAIYQIQIIMLAAKDILEDFPHKLPDPSDIYDVVSEVAKSISCAKDVERDSFFNISKMSSNDPLVVNSIRLLINRSNTGDIDFNSILCSQELVMLLAHLDAFMVNSLKTMCKKKPEILRRSKKLSWNDILACGDWDTLVEKIINDYSYEFGMKSIKNKTLYLTEQHGLDIEVSESVLDEIDFAQELRHIIVHNGGRVSQEFIKRTGRKDFELDKHIVVLPGYIEDISHDALQLGSETYTEIAKKFFGLNDDQIWGVWKYKDGVAIRGIPMRKTSSDNETEAEANDS